MGGSINFKEIPTQKPEEDLSNEEVMYRILESGTSEELEKLRKFNNFTHEQLKLFCDFAKLRKKVVTETWDNVEKREKENPIATEEELNMGCYTEMIEPQVRDAVLDMRRKGYSTYESGFYGENFQQVGCLGEPFKDLEFSEELISVRVKTFIPLFK